MERQDIERLVSIETNLKNIITLLEDVRTDIKDHFEEDDKVHEELRKEVVAVQKRMWGFTGGLSVLTFAIPLAIKYLA